MADHKTEIRFKKLDGTNSRDVWRDVIPPRPGDVVWIDDGAGEIKAQMCGGAWITFEQGVQVFTVRVQTGAGKGWKVRDVG